MRESISNVARRMNDDCKRVAIHIFGYPNLRLCNNAEWRWGEHGRFRLHIAGAKRGRWNDFATGQRGDMLDLIGWELSLDTRSSIDWALDWLGGNIGIDRKSPLALPISARDIGIAENTGHLDAIHRRKKALSVWDESKPVPGTLAEIYLTKKRGLPLTQEILAADAFRFHPRLYFEGSKVPGLVALMRDPVTSKPVGIQRTFLGQDGRKIERRMLGSAGVVMLSPGENISYGIGLVEGMENGLAVMALTGWQPVFAAMSAGAIRTFPYLEGMETVTIFADADGAGRSAANECGRRLSKQGIEVRVFEPPKFGDDWNDYFLRWRVT